MRDLGHDGSILKSISMKPQFKIPLPPCVVFHHVIMQQEGNYQMPALQCGLPSL